MTQNTVANEIQEKKTNNDLQNITTPLKQGWTQVCLKWIVYNEVMDLWIPTGL